MKCFSQTITNADTSGKKIWRAVGGLPRKLSTRLLRGVINSTRSLGHKKAENKIDLVAWGQQVLPEHFGKPPSKMHRWLADELQSTDKSRGRRINVIGPRGSAKSTLVTLAYVLRMAVENREPYIWIVGDTRRQAELHLQNIKHELEGNKQLAEAYHSSCGRGPCWQSGRIELSNGVVIEAIGTGKRIRGRRRGATRPTLIVCDDLENDSHTHSSAQREASRHWFQSTLIHAGTKETNVVNLATALHRDALALHLRHQPSWKSRVFRAIETWPIRQDLWDEWERIYNSGQFNARMEATQFYRDHHQEMQRGVELLWPEVEDLLTLMKLRVESGATAFEREKQGRPLDPRDREWPDEYFADDIWFDHWPRNLSTRVIALDPSKGRDSRHGDYSAYVALGVDRDGTWYLEADLARRDIQQMIADGVALCQRFRPQRFGIEANQWQSLLADEFVTALEAGNLTRIEICTITNYTNKVLRIRRLTPLLATRQIRFHRASHGTQLLVEQLRDFPLASHDDGPDALEMAMRLAEQVGPSDDGLGDRLSIAAI